MLSTHLAELYGVETRILMQAIKRNRNRFPEDFMFSLTREEILRISQIVTSLKYSKAVYAFTEPRVAMLSSVLHSGRAIEMNDEGWQICVPGANRTRNPQLRRLVLYPIELRARRI